MNGEFDPLLIKAEVKSFKLVQCQVWAKYHLPVPTHPQKAALRQYSNILPVELAPFGVQLSTQLRLALA